MDKGSSICALPQHSFAFVVIILSLYENRRSYYNSFADRNGPQNVVSLISLGCDSKKLTNYERENEETAINGGESVLAGIIFSPFAEKCYTQCT